MDNKSVLYFLMISLMSVATIKPMLIYSPNPPKKDPIFITQDEAIRISCKVNMFLESLQEDGNNEDSQILLNDFIHAYHNDVPVEGNSYAMLKEMGLAGLDKKIDRKFLLALQRSGGPSV